MSPPLREDDRDGHYNFSLRDNLTPRCELFFFICTLFTSTHCKQSDRCLVLIDIRRSIAYCFYLLTLTDKILSKMGEG